MDPRQAAQPGSPRSSAADAGSAAPVADLVPGYRIEHELHRGGQGVVFRATQVRTGRPVALKVLREGPLADEHARRRFEREIELIAALRHPHIVTILDCGTHAGRLWYAMELIDGLPLNVWLDRAQPGLTDVVRLFVQVCDAVGFAHQRGVIHRDLKPGNVLVDRDGRPRVVDFGLAKPLRPLDGGQTTLPAISTTGQVLGTLAYMAPEQAAGSDFVDTRCDVYSLGAMLYEALAGQPPIVPGGSLGQILERIARQDPPPLRARGTRTRFGRRIDDELETIVLKALDKDPARRYQTAGELGRDLERYLAGEPVEAKRASGLYLLRKTLRRYRWQVGTALALLAVLAGSALGLSVLYTRERAARARADRLEVLARQRAEEGPRGPAAGRRRAAAGRGGRRGAARRVDAPAHPARPARQPARESGRRAAGVLGRAARRTGRPGRPLGAARVLPSDRRCRRATAALRAGRAGRRGRGSAVPPRDVGRGGRGAGRHCDPRRACAAGRCAGCRRPGRRCASRCRKTGASRQAVPDGPGRGARRARGLRWRAICRRASCRRASPQPPMRRCWSSATGGAHGRGVPTAC